MDITFERAKKLRDVKATIVCPAHERRVIDGVIKGYVPAEPKGLARKREDRLIILTRGGLVEYRRADEIAVIKVNKRYLKER